MERRLAKRIFGSTEPSGGGLQDVNAWVRLAKASGLFSIRGNSGVGPLTWRSARILDSRKHQAVPRGSGGLRHLEFQD